MKRLLVFFLLTALVLGLFAGCAQTDKPAEDPTDEPGGDVTVTDAPDDTPEGEIALTDPALQSDFVCEDNYRVFYEIFVGSFSDSNGDGIGDLRGIINRMDYLNDGDPNSGKSLGVEGLWLTPIFQSPSYHKYDVTDYYTIDPAFGTMDDLKELVELCHQRNVKVILDMVINHSAKNAPWFSEFVKAQRDGDTASPYYDFYSFCAKDARQPGISYSPVTGTDNYYECNFWDQMPELNYDSEFVRQTMLDVAKYYLELGIDGFRFDAAKYIYFNDHPRNQEFWNWYMGELRAVKPDVYAVAEVWDSDSVTDQYYPALDCFNFTISQQSGMLADVAMKGSVSRLTGYLDSYLDKIQSLREGAMLMPFLTNHDMDRASGFLTVESGSAQMAANLYILGPGSPFLYYGEELGMRGSRGSSNTDANRRLAMLWGDGDTIQDPEGTTYSASNQISHGVADQILDENSLYTYYKRLIMIRRANPEIARGDYTPISFGDSKAGGFLAAWQGQTVCVIHNTTDKEVTLDLSTVTDLPFALAAVIGMSSASLNGTVLTLGGQTSVVLR